MLHKKRKKVSRMRGSHTHGRGFMKKGRGSGQRGGKGMAGTGKRADQKKTLIIKKGINYFGSPGLKPKIRKYEVINVSEIERLANGKKEIDLNNYKILGNGEIKISIKINALSASKSAIDKVKKAGGEIILKNGSQTNTQESA
ncbi:uL15 family ribosomal protein [Candidatus Pacearchaeota archaeon]|nr:uL15 family ribosomal protein [Candidatus Pacearchaeota archaeon]